MKNKIKLALSPAAALLTALSLTAPVMAAENTLKPPANFGTLANITIQTVVPAIIQLLLIVAFIVAFIFLILGGVRWMLSGGDKAAAESARGTLTAAIIGLIIVLAAWAIIIVIQTLFGIEIIGSNVFIPEIYKK